MQFETEREKEEWRLGLFRQQRGSFQAGFSTLIVEKQLQLGSVRPAPSSWQLAARSLRLSLVQPGEPRATVTDGLDQHRNNNRQ